MKNYLNYLEPNNLLQFRLGRLSKYFAVVVLIMGALTFAAWQWNIYFLKSLVPARNSMNSLTALGMISAAISFLLLSPSGVNLSRKVNLSREGRYVGHVLAVTLLVLGCMQAALRIDDLLSFDQYRVVDNIMPDVPGPMTLGAAVCFILAGTSLLLLNTVTKAGWAPAHFIAVAVGMLGLFSMVSFLYRVQMAYGPLRYAPMAVSTTICFVLFSAFVLLGDPGKGMMQGFTCNSTGGRMARRLLPLVLLLPIILGYLRLTGYWKGRFSGEFLAMAIVLNIIVIFFTVIWYNTYLLNKRDAQRRESESMLLQSEHRYHLLINSVKDYAIFVLDTAGYVESWNEGAERIKGYSEKEILGKHISVFYAAEEIEKGEPEENLAHARQEVRFEKEGWRVRKDGSLFWADISLTAMYDAKRRLLGFTNVTRDITERKKLEQQLQRFSDDLEVQVKIKTADLSGILERINDAFIATDEDFCYTYINKKAGDLIRLDPAPLIGKSVWNIFPDAIGSAVYHAFNKAMADQKNSTITAYYTPLDVWLEHHLYPSPEGLSVFIRDITEQRKSGKEITDYKYALDQSSIVSITDRNAIIKHANENFCKHSKFTEEELIGQDHRIVNSGYHSKTFMQDLRSTIENGEIWKGEICNKAKDGSLYWLDTTIIPFLNENGDPYEYLAISADITERKKKEVELMVVADLLERSYQDIREHPSHLQDVRDEERVGIAREIHDELGQQLTGIKMDLSWISKKLPVQESSEVRVKIDGALDLLDATIRTVRRIATELRPAVLHDLGLVAAIQRLNQHFQKRLGIPSTFVSNVSEFKGPSTMAVGLFRICQESLTNIARHAEAENVYITLHENEEKTILLKIEDDGKGFRPENVGREKTLGLLGMKERALMIGGDLEIVSVPGGGTTLSVSIPINVIETVY